MMPESCNNKYTLHTPTQVTWNNQYLPMAKKLCFHFLHINIWITLMSFKLPWNDKLLPQFSIFIHFY